HLGPGGPVEVAVHLVVLEEVPVPRHLLELGRRDEVVLPALDLTVASRARRVGDRKEERLARGVREEAADEGRLASPRLRREDDQVALRRLAHSTLRTCSRIFSISAFMSSTSRVDRRSRLLDPSVFSSRRISWERKSSVLPTAAGGFERRPSN